MGEIQIHPGKEDARSFCDGAALGTYAGLGNTSPGLSALLLPLAVGSMGMVSAYSIWFAVLLGLTILYAIFIKDAPWFQLRNRGRTLTTEELVDLDLADIDVHRGNRDRLSAGNGLARMVRHVRPPDGPGLARQGITVRSSP